MLWSCVWVGWSRLCVALSSPHCAVWSMSSLPTVSSARRHKRAKFPERKAASLCEHLLSPFFLCSSLRRQGAICPWTKELPPSFPHPNSLTRQKCLYISRLFLVCRHALCIISRNVSHDGKYLHLACHSGKRQAFPGGRDKAAAQKAHSSVLLCLRAAAAFILSQLCSCS